MNPIPCKQCISYAICNSKFQDTKNVMYEYEMEYIARMLIDKCSIIRDYLINFYKLSDSVYVTYDGVVITVNIKPFINTFIDSQSSSSLLTTLKLVYDFDNDNIYKRSVINIP